MKKSDYCRSNQTGDTQSGRPASGLGAKGKRRIHADSRIRSSADRSDSTVLILGSRVTPFRMFSSVLYGTFAS